MSRERWCFIRNGIPVSRTSNADTKSIKVDLGNEIAEIRVHENKILYSPKTEQAAQQPIQEQERRGFASAVSYPRGNPHIAKGNLMGMNEVNCYLDGVVNGAAR